MVKHSPRILELGSDFYDSVEPAQFPEAHLRFKNDSAAHSLGLSLTVEQWRNYFHGFKPLPENLQAPLALKYHGHQFLVYNPDLGDGRGFLYAQITDNQNRLMDLGTKGSGQTPYSRNGDGRLTLKGAIREILATELLESYGLNTSKTFCVFETGEKLLRNDEPSPTRSAVLTRLCHSHIRIGTFQRLATLQQTENIKKLVDYCVRHYFPKVGKLSEVGSQDQAQLFLQQVTRNLSALSAQLMLTGFVHGVLNSDNINVTGECFDYGPYRFLPKYDPRFTAAYFDHQGLYCFGRQPSAIQWNLQQLAKSLRVAWPNLDVESAIQGFTESFSKSVLDGFLIRLNLKSQGSEQDNNLLAAFFQFMLENPVYFEQTFFDLFGGLSDRTDRSPQKEFYQTSTFQELKSILETYSPLDLEKMRHPYFQKASPCTALIEEIEFIWSEIDQKNNWAIFDEKIAQIRSFRGLYRLF